MTRVQVTDEEWGFLELYLLIGEFGPFPGWLRWWLRSGGQWREMPREFGARPAVHSRFRWWWDVGVDVIAARPDTAPPTRACSSRGTRACLRRRHITAAIPDKADQAAHRKKKGLQGWPRGTTRGLTHQRRSDLSAASTQPRHTPEPRPDPTITVFRATMPRRPIPAPARLSTIQDGAARSAGSGAGAGSGTRYRMRRSRIRLSRSMRICSRSTATSARSAATRSEVPISSRRCTYWP